MKLTLLALLLVSVLNAADFVTKLSPYSVDVTISKLTKIVKSKGFNIFALVDHAKGAKKVGLPLEDQQVLIFGKPQAGTKIMQKDRLAGFDLPIKVMVYQDGKSTKVVYRTKEYFMANYLLDGCKVVDKMSGALDMMTNKAIGK